ncbi:MAG: AMP-binding protein [Clostridia bacterium]|nr:AMP-binding protein [Clostridia bacterium]
MENKKYAYHEAGNYDNIPHYLKYITNKHGSKIAFKYTVNKKDVEKTYQAFYNDVQNLAKSIAQMKYNNDKISILGENSYHWVVSYMAISCSNNTVVPIDKDLQMVDIQSIIEEADVKLLFLSDQYNDYAEPLKQAFPELQIINISEIEKYIAKGKNTKVKLPDVSPEQIASIIYTSGTTSKPKGVMLTHKGLAIDTIGCQKHFMLTGDSILVLPLHHTFALTAHILFGLTCGYAVCIPSSLKKIDELFKKYKPSTMIVVPMLVEAFYNKIWKTIRASGKEKLVRNMIKISNFLLKLKIDIRPKVFKQIIEGLGGNLNLIISGGASLEPSYVADFRSFGIDVFNGYGITECSPVVSVNRNGYYRDGSVGPVLNGVEVKILKQDDNVQEGEILVKGDIVMKGYYKHPELTKEAMTEDGYFNTGDIGYVDEDGFLFITGRKKNIIILDNGKNIYPEELEGKLQKKDGIKEVVVFEKDKKIAAEIFPDFELIPNDENAKEAVQKIVDEFNKDLPFYKKIDTIEIRDTEFEKTTTKKIKRNYNRQ